MGSRSGIPRVVLKLARELAGRTPLDLVRWDALEGRLRFLDRHEFDHLFGRTAWPEGLKPRLEARKLRVRLGDEVKEKMGVWVLQPEAPYHSPDGLQAFATWTTQVREYGWQTAAVIYDMIPLHNPAYFDARAAHLRYLAEVVRADLLLPISRHSGDQLQAFARSHGLGLPTVRAAPLGVSDVRQPQRTHDGGSILALGTVEPRKRQIELVRAYAKGRLESPALADLELRIAGALHPAVAREFEALVDRTPGVRYRSYLPEAEVEAAWGDAAFSVFASDDEGFGLPVAESLARGVPCIAVDKPPMTEIAEGAGVRWVAAADPDRLCEALVALAEAPAERERLRQEIAARVLRTWGDYADDVLAAMTGAVVAPQPGRPAVAATSGDALAVQARADVVRFPDAAARDAFIEACGRELAPGLLPSRLPVGAEPDPTPTLSAFRGRLTHIAGVERSYGQAMRTLSGEAKSRPVFLRIVVTTYNRRAFVLQNARWLLDKVVREQPDVELVIVDNASTDGSGAALRDSFQHRRCRIIENAANVGMLGNMRVCSQLPGAEYVWLIGDDDFIVASQLNDILTALRASLGAPLAYLNFGVYYRQTLGRLDTVEALQAEGRPLAGRPAPSGLYPLSVAAAQHDNLFTAIYINIWRADVLAAAYDHPFDGAPFSSLVESIPCTKTLLESFGECEVYWHAPAAIIGNAHNSWVRHRPRWHARLMPEALALARDIGVNPDVLQGWADHQGRLYDEACELATRAGYDFNLDEPDALQLSWPLFRRRLALDAA